MKIKEHSVVTLNYKLNAGLPNETMQHIESTDPNQPFQFLSGIGGLIRGFEDNLMGLQQGDKFDFKLEASEAYGDTDQSVTMDFNHPLAGHQLHFAGEIVSVREATPDEISHGHVHDGHVH